VCPAASLGERADLGLQLLDPASQLPDRHPGRPGAGRGRERRQLAARAEDLVQARGQRRFTRPS